MDPLMKAFFVTGIIYYVLYIVGFIGQMINAFVHNYKLKKHMDTADYNVKEED